MKIPYLSLNSANPIRFRIFLVLTAAVALAFLPALVAQEAAAPPDAPGDAAAQTAVPVKQLTLLDLYKTGGWAMHFLLLGSICFVALSVYNGIALRPTKLLGGATYGEIQDAIKEMNFDRVVEICKTNPCLLNNVVRAGFERVNEAVSPSAIESGMEEAATEEVQKAMTPVSFLSVIAVVAPMVGLLGTVSGMIKAFRAMALGGMGRPELLADNISEALITTAGGLIVGIPAMIAYFFFKQRLLSSVATMSRLAGNLVQSTKRVLRLYQHGMLPNAPKIQMETEG